MKRLLTLLLLGMLLLPTACKRTVIIPDEELAMIFRDAFLTNAYVEHKRIKEDSLNLYAPIFDRYGYTTEDVQMTIGNFSKRKSARLSDVVERAIELLEEEGLRYDHQVVILDTIKQVALRTTRTVLLQDSLIEIRRAQDTTLVHFTLPAEEGDYELSYSYRVDSLDKNTRLQRKMWFQRENGSKGSLQIMNLQRHREERTTRTLHADSSADSIHLQLLVLPEKPKRTSVTIRNLQLVHVLPERAAIEELYRQQLGIRIFADDFFGAALQNEQPIEKDSIQ